MTSNVFSKRDGYLMVEVFVAISISLIVMSTVSIMLNESMDLIEQTDSRIEIREQFNEMKNTIRRELRNSSKVKFYYMGKNIDLGNKFVEIDELRFAQFEDMKLGNANIAERLMYISEMKKKIFIHYNNGAYEIGNYVEGIEAKQDSDSVFSIKLKLNKNNNRFSDIISIRMRN